MNPIFEMHDPAHPGQVLKAGYIDGSGLTLTEVAARLGVSRNSLSELVNGRRGVSVEMALRLSVAFGTTPQLWLNMQRGYDLWHARQNLDLSAIKPITAQP